MFIPGSEYPTNIWFNFENTITRQIFIIFAQKHIVASGSEHPIKYYLELEEYIPFRGCNSENAKEVAFFNTWTLATSEEGSFTSNPPNAGSVPEGSYFIDGTPKYLNNLMAAPRLQEVVPGAKFVVVLQACVPCCLKTQQTKKKQQSDKHNGWKNKGKGMGVCVSSCLSASV